MSASFSTPRPHAVASPDRVAAVLEPGGQTLTFADLDDRSARLAAALRGQGLAPGNVIACYLPNTTDYLVVTWACRRGGFRYSNINTHLTLSEISHILEDSGAKGLVCSIQFTAQVAALGALLDRLVVRISVDGPMASFDELGEVLADATPSSEDEVEGQEMLFTGGTTGRPKGVTTQFSSGYIDATRNLIGLTADDVQLIPTPLYHGLANRMAVTGSAVGCTSVLMEAWDAEAFLGLIGRYRATVVSVVPSILVRLLKLPAEVRTGFDTSSLRVALVTGAPCPVHVKEQMIEWWGPIITEGYGATEGVGMAGCTSADWLAHKGTIGRATVGIPHIVGEDGRELGPGEVGLLYFENGPDFSYHNDPERTAATRNAAGWRTVGDVARLDEDGYIYLADRQDFMILVNGVNVYPQQTEDVLLAHPKVRDAAVFGVPDELAGEQVKAVVELQPDVTAGPQTAAELMDFCRQQLATIKCPKSIDFTEQLPRDATGKLRKGQLRDAYRAGASG